MQPNEKEKISELLQRDSSRVYAARKLSRWFSLYIRIQMFGQTVFEKEIPPTLFSLVDEAERNDNEYFHKNIED